MAPEPVLTTPCAVREHHLQARIPQRRCLVYALLTIDRSSVMRSNITLLGTVFAAAFGMQLYVVTPVAGDAE